MGGTASSRNFAESVINQSVSQVNTAAQNSTASAFSFQNISKVGGVGDLIVRRTKMKAKVEVNMVAMFDAQQSNSASQDAAQSLEQMSKASVSGINLGNASSVINEVRTAINSVISGRNEMLQTCRTEAGAVQNISAVGTDGDVIVEDVEMDAAVSNTVSCIGKAVQENSAIQKAQQSISQSATAETVGLDLSAFFMIFVIIAAGALLVCVVGVMFVGAISKGAASAATKVVSGLTNWKTLLAVVLVVVGIFVYVLFLSDYTKAEPRIMAADGTVKPMPLGGGDEDPFIFPFLKPHVLRGQDDPFPPAPGQLPMSYKFESKLTSVETGSANSIDELRAKIFPTKTDSVSEGEFEELRARYASVTTIYWNTFTKEYELFAGRPSYELWQMWKKDENSRPEFQRMRIDPQGQPRGYCDPKDEDFDNPKACRAVGGNEVFSDNPRYFNSTKYNMLKLSTTAQDLTDRLLCIMLNIFSHMDAVTANTNKASFYDQCGKAEEAIIKMASDRDSDRNSSLPGAFVGAAGGVADFFTGGQGGSSFANLVKEITDRKEGLQEEFKFPREAIINPDPRVMWAILFGNGIKNPVTTTALPALIEFRTGPAGSPEMAPARESARNTSTVRICLGFTAGGVDPRSTAAINTTAGQSACSESEGLPSVRDVESVVAKLQRLRTRVISIQDEIYGKFAGWNIPNLPQTVKDKARSETNGLLLQWDRDFETWWQDFEKGFDHFNTGNVARGLGDIRDITIVFLGRVFPGQRKVNLEGVPGGSSDSGPGLLIGVIVGIVAFIVGTGLLLRKINNAKALSLGVRESAELSADKTREAAEKTNELVARVRERKAQMALQKMEAKLASGDFADVDESSVLGMEVGSSGKTTSPGGGGGGRSGQGAQGAAAGFDLLSRLFI